MPRPGQVRRQGVVTGAAWSVGTLRTTRVGRLGHTLKDVMHRRHAVKLFKDLGALSMGITIGALSMGITIGALSMGIKTWFTVNGHHDWCTVNGHQDLVHCQWASRLVHCQWASRLVHCQWASRPGSLSMGIKTWFTVNIPLSPPFSLTLSNKPRTHLSDPTLMTL